MITPRHETNLPAAENAERGAEMPAPVDSANLGPLSADAALVDSVVAEPVLPSVPAPAEQLTNADAPLPVTAGGGGAEPGWASVDDQSTSAEDGEEAAAPEESPGIFGGPRIRDLHCLHEIRLDEGRTLVRIRWAGWGMLCADAVLDGQIFQWRLIYAWPREQVIDLLVPMGATLNLSVRNLWGRDYRTLQVLPSEPVLPRTVLPPTPDVTGVRMLPPRLPSFPSAAIAQLIPAQLRVAVRTRRPLPSTDDKLRHAITLESKRLSVLPRVLGSRQHYERQRLSPRYGQPPLSPDYRSLRPGDANMVPVRDRLKAWMVEIHHGEDETEGG